jgi:hypothetical protein
MVGAGVLALGAGGGVTNSVGNGVFHGKEHLRFIRRGEDQTEVDGDM